jgi:hypothetical protein
VHEAGQPISEGREAGQEIQRRAEDDSMTIFKASRAWVAVSLTVLGVFSLGVVSTSPASAAAGSRWQLTSGSWPANLPVGGEGTIVVAAENLGDGEVDGTSTSVTIVDKLPAGVTPTGISGTAGFSLFQTNGSISLAGPVECIQPAGPCEFKGKLPPYELLQVHITVKSVQASANGADNVVGVSGGGTPAASLSEPLRVSGEAPRFGVEDYSATPENEDGSLDTQAGSHPFQFTTTTVLREGAQLQTGEVTPTALARDLSFKLPAGLVGDPSAIPQCSELDFSSLGPRGGEWANCPHDTIIGVATISIDIRTFQGVSTETVPVFNLVPSVGEPARFGFVAFGNPVTLDTAVRTGGDYGVTVTASNITQVALFIASRVTFWGVPGDPRHDNSRGWNCTVAFLGPCPASPTVPQVPFLTLPTSCEAPFASSVEGDSWPAPGTPSQTAERVSYTLPQGLDGCNRLGFEPSLSVVPDGRAASTPTGLTVSQHLNQEEILAPTGLAESSLKSVTATLPEGVVINPAGADGLEACSEAQVGFTGVEESSGADLFTPKLESPFCPDAAKVGTAKIETPLLPNALEGAVYLAAQNANPFGSLVAMYIVAEDPVSGVVVKVPGEVSLNQRTGRITATFEHLPQTPVENVELHFFGGERAPLATPSHCGSYTAEIAYTPWSGNAPVDTTSTFEITSGPNHSACPGAALPFSAALTGGTVNNQAGSFSAFTMTMSREDGSQNLKSIELHMPPGLSGVLTGIPLCGEAQADAGTCPAASLIGETTVSVGLGGSPFTVRGGQVFLTGPYRGAPFGLSIVNPAVAGPFDLGKVIVRAKLDVNPITAAVTVTSDSTGPYAIPPSIQGIPLEIKHVNVTIDRPGGFTFNPTNCSPAAVTGSLQSIEGATQTLSVPFQATNCAVLKFAPKFAVSTSGKTSKANGASLTVKLTYPSAPFGSQANIARVKVDLPKQLPSRLTTLQKACTAAQFEANPAGCPSASIVGHAKAITPLIPVPLEGPAYFVSHGGEAFPSLIMVLQGYGVTLDLVGTTFISKAGITSSTFKTVPDAPVGSFELTLPQGRFSALTANGNLCTSKLAMPTEFLAQNGAAIHESTPVSVTGCSKRKVGAGLAAALRACRKKTRGHKRAACERAARRKHGATGAKRRQ